MRDIASIRDYIQCPRCASGDLRISASAIECGNCSSIFPFEAGIANFIDPASEFMKNQFWLKGQVGEESVKFWHKIKAQGGFKGPSPFNRLHSQAQYQKCVELRSGAKPKACLEIGPGTHPRLSYYEAETKIALDPLMGLHLELFPDNFDGIACMTSIAESLPIKSNTIDYVALGNCLDHFSNPQKGLTEVLRVMSSDGYLFYRLGDL